MKKLITLILTLLLIFSPTANALPKWANVLIADGIGAAIGYITGGPPRAIVRGVSKSVVTAITKTTSPRPVIVKAITNPQNEFDYVGIAHNNIIRDYYMKKVSTTNNTIIVDFVIKSAMGYGYKTTDITNSSVLSMVKQYNDQNLETSDAIIACFGTIVPDVLKAKFKLSLDKILATTNLAGFNQIILYEENLIISDKSLNEQSRGALKCFFSVLRHSAALWAE